MSNSLETGVVVTYRRQSHAIMKILDEETILLRNIQTGGVVNVRLEELDTNSPLTHLEGKQIDLSLIAETPWNTAVQRYQAIEPLLNVPKGFRTQERIKTQADIAGVHAATIYRWLDQYERSGKVTALLPKERQDKGTYRISNDVERIVQEIIDSLYLTQERPGITTVVKKVMDECRVRGIEAPHYNTVRRRIRDRGAYRVMARRLGKKAAEDKFRPSRGQFPGADFPMSVVQIDHVKLDIELVDAQEGRPIGRAWLTVMICVRTRMIPGFFLSLDAPNAFSVAMCVTNAILPKDHLLAKHDLKTRWPISGFPHIIHTDNAREFHSQALERACTEYGITQVYRPRGRPEFGGHVERLAKTLNDALHQEPGTTFNNPKERGRYKSEEKAIYTLDRLEERLVRQIDIYHHTYHENLRTTPLQRFRDDVWGDENSPGVGLQDLSALDDHRLRLDFMPFEMRSVQDYGIRLFNSYYFHDVLKPWINSNDPEHNRRKRKFIVRYAPNNINEVYFFDPELKDYFPIPLRNASVIPLSAAEARKLRQQDIDEGKAAEDQAYLAQARQDLQNIRDQAKKETKSARRKSEQKRQAAIPVVPRKYFEERASSQGIDLNQDVAFTLAPGFEEVDFD